MLLSLRWIFLFTITLPLSFAVIRWTYLRDWWVYEVRKGSAAGHDDRVKEIQEQIKRYVKSGNKAKLCTARKSWSTMSLRYPTYKGKENAISIDLYDILSLDTKKQTVTVEPMVNIGRLTHYLVPKGWTLPVVPELDDLTVGGLVNGYGIESTSHKHGLFFDNVVACTVVLGNGQVVEARADNAYRDLFQAISWSHGCLGFLVSVELRVVPASAWVRLEYHPLAGLDNIVTAVNDASTAAKPTDIVEALQFDLNSAVLMKGNFVNTVPPGGLINALNSWYKPWFYKHVEEILRRNDHVVEYIPLRDYYHRHTRGLFWQVEMMIPFGNHPLVRLLLGWLYPPHIAVLKATQGRTLAKYFQDMLFVQDILVPCPQLKNSLIYNEEQFGIYPLWLCPHKTTRTNPSGFLKPHDPDAEEYEMYMDVGIYGVPRAVKERVPFSQAEASWQIGEWLRQRGGYQALYAITEMSRQEFELMFDHTLFHSIRSKYSASECFPEPYDKIVSK